MEFDIQTLVEQLQVDYDENAEWRIHYPYHTPTQMGVELSVAQEIMQYEPLTKDEKIGIILTIPIRYLCLYNGYSPNSKECYELVTQTVEGVENKGPVSEIILSNLSGSNDAEQHHLPEMIFKDVQQIAVLSTIDDKYHEYKKELEVFYNGHITDELLMLKLKQKFDTCNFYSLYGSRQYGSLLDDRIKWAKNTNKVLDLKRDKFLMKELAIDENQLKFFRKKIDKYEKTPDRGIETWFRLASRNLYTRRQILDNKSNILLTINAIIISVTVGTLFPLVAESWSLILPVVCILITNLLSIAFAILASRPGKPKKATALDFSKAIKGLMTFDDFHFLNEKSYLTMVQQMLSNKDMLYPTIIHDIYSLGVELNDKYKFIRLSYDVFLGGIIISVIVFIISYIIS